MTLVKECFGSVVVVVVVSWTQVWIIGTEEYRSCYVHAKHVLMWVHNDHLVRKRHYHVDIVIPVRSHNDSEDAVAATINNISSHFCCYWRNIVGCRDDYELARWTFSLSFVCSFLWGIPSM